MKAFLRIKTSLFPLYVIGLCTLLWLLFFYDGTWNRLFVTADQKAYALYEKKEYQQAAGYFEDHSFKGAAYFKNGNFKEAVLVYQNLSDKVGKYNLGNAQVMLGNYDKAIEAYKVALEIDPNFTEAKENLKLAKARKILKEPENDGEQGVGELGADEIVFDNTEGKGVDDDSSAQEEASSGNPNWLDRLQTGPKDFLKNKFRYQYEREGQKR